MNIIMQKYYQIRVNSYILIKQITKRKPKTDFLYAKGINAQIFKNFDCPYIGVV